MDLNNKIQKQVFHTGGFVLHKITGSFKGKVSAWFNKKGELLDLEQILPNGKIKYVKSLGPIWKLAESFGRVYRD